MPFKDDLYDRTPADERAERAELGFQRQPEVRWLTPSLLAKSGVEVLVSGTFGKFADKREIQTTDQGDQRGTFDYSDRAVGDDGLWIDYLSDTGDGWNATYTMAWLLARESLPVAVPDGDNPLPPLPRGSVLLLGGDQVYPSAGAIAYEDRFIGPFESALPRSTPGTEPDMFATPGNHDWYDGLVSFMRVFCRTNGWIGGWKTRQRRSYFAIKLPNNWWIWAIDIQLDTFIDDVQLDYFTGQKLEAGDKVILMTAKPSWVKAKANVLEPDSWKYLAFFEDRMIRDRDARLAIVVTGDMHHYARYEPEEPSQGEAPTRITAGGGGAYLSATHTLPESLELQSMSRKPNPDRPQRPNASEVPRTPVGYGRKTVYPTLSASAELGKGIRKLRTLNPEFAKLFGAVYGLIALAMMAALNAAPGPLELHDRVGTFLSSAFGPATLLLVAVLFGGAYTAAEIKADANESPRKLKWQRGLVTSGHGLAHLVAVTSIVFVAVVLLAVALDGVEWGWFWLFLARLATVVIAVALAFLAGKFVGTGLWSIVMLWIHTWRGTKAPENANQVFTGQSIVEYKNFLRMRFDKQGGLTIYALGVDTICKTWDYQGKSAVVPGSRFEPRDGTTPAVKLIDVPLRYSASGERLHGVSAPAAS